MKGLDLSFNYYHDVVFPSFSKEFPQQLPGLAFGLAGPGSECFGFDDELSRDHDWGPRVCIWLSEKLDRTHGTAMQKAYENLPAEYAGFGPIRRLDTRSRHDGVLSISRFFVSCLGTDQLPKTNRDWLLLPEPGLALCTNGRIFADPSGEFSEARHRLSTYYPRDIQLKKLASRLKAAGQSGQYNLWRSLSRGDGLAAAHFRHQFLRETASIFYVLQRKYRPFDKWLFRGLREFDHSSNDFLEQGTALLKADGGNALRDTISNMTLILTGAIEKTLPWTKRRDFLYDWGLDIERAIEDRAIREELDTID